jgi:hypothetical protein
LAVSSDPKGVGRVLTTIASHRAPVNKLIPHFLLTSFVVASCGSEANPTNDPVRTTHEALGTPYNWLQYNGDAGHAGNNTLETRITAQNRGSGFHGGCDWRLDDIRVRGGRVQR